MPELYADAAAAVLEFITEGVVDLLREKHSPPAEASCAQIIRCGYHFIGDALCKHEADIAEVLGVRPGTGKRVDAGERLGRILDNISSKASFNIVNSGNPTKEISLEYSWRCVYCCALYSGLAVAFHEHLHANVISIVERSLVCALRASSISVEWNAVKARFEIGHKRQKVSESHTFRSACQAQIDALPPKALLLYLSSSRASGECVLVALETLWRWACGGDGSFDSNESYSDWSSRITLYCDSDTHTCLFGILKTRGEIPSVQDLTFLLLKRGLDLAMHADFYRRRLQVLLRRK